MVEPKVRAVYEKLAAKKHKRPFDIAVSDSKGTTFFQTNEAGITPLYLSYNKCTSEFRQSLAWSDRHGI